jgi:hypothetical protein
VGLGVDELRDDLRADRRNPTGKADLAAFLDSVAAALTISTVFQRDFHGGSRPWSCHITD